MSGTTERHAERRLARDASGVDHRGLWQVLERFAGTLVDRFALDDVLTQLGADVRRVLGVAGAGVMLGDEQGDLRFTSASDRVLDELEALQVELDEGPCLLAYRTGAVVLATDLRDDDRFPAFGARAVEAGMAAVYSFPMRMEDACIGALNMYGAEPGGFTDEQIAAGRTFADVATSYLANARDSEQKELLTKQLQQALHSRVVIEQAKGYVAAMTGLGLADAFELIRSYARSHQMKVRVIARGVLFGDMAVDDLRRDRGGRAAR